MSGLAVLCSGQGNQHPGMLDVALASAPGAEVVRRAGEAVALDLAAVARAGGPDLVRNAVAQPLLCAATLGTWEALRLALPAPRVLAGYSVGELAAYGCAGALGPEELARLAARRAALMDAASGVPGGLVALRGLSRARAESLARAAGGALAIVNGPDRCVVGAPAAALEALEAAARAAGASTQRLAVHVAAHTPLVAEAVAPFAAALGASALRDPQIAVLAGTTGVPVYRRAEAIGALSRQLAEMLDWERCLGTAAELGCTVFLELGPGAALAHLAAETLPGAAARSVCEFRTVEGIRRWVERALEEG